MLSRVLHQWSRVCVRWSLLSAHKQRHLQRVHRSIQQRSHAAGAGESAGAKSRLWLCGVGVGVAVAFAVGLKSRRDLADSPVGPRGTDVSGFRGAVETSRELLERVQAEVGAPGLVVGVSVDGVQVWCEGMGYADLENRVPCSADTVMRIASISKSLTSAAAARLCEEGKLELDEPVQKYVPEFPEKQFEGQDVTVTTRMVLSHLSGIRHYEKDANKVREEREKAKGQIKPKGGEQEEKQGQKKAVRKKSEFELEEYYLKDHFNSMTEALDLFKDDPLIFKPGTTYLYSTHAFTLLGAVVERAAAQPFLDYLATMFRDVGMVHTVPELNEPIIYHRSRCYHLNKKGRVVNCPYVDNSYKWPGGGFLSTAGDLLLFGNALLYSYQIAQLKDTEGLLPGYLKPHTALELWTPVDNTEGSWDKEGQYAQGWLVVQEQQKYGQCRKRRHYVSHTGGAVGASSVLLVYPAAKGEPCKGSSEQLPRGVVVTIMANMQSVGLNTTALAIAQQFDRARHKP
ncbi:serine beta-lactamase-like protein LACTB, mitochondrial [Eucyclogobius newberryi]|uniref:serine beta-lactamase-like protein LACTB, mitochondrial n=1 Tax=Eucyclogobius newberryi TaxID=166745 RepID=UPI003B5C47F1